MQGPYSDSRVRTRGLRGAREATEAARRRGDSGDSTVEAGAHVSGDRLDLSPHDDDGARFFTFGLVDPRVVSHNKNSATMNNAKNLRFDVRSPQFQAIAR